MLNKWKNVAMDEVEEEKEDVVEEILVMEEEQVSNDVQKEMIQDL